MLYRYQRLLRRLAASGLLLLCANAATAATWTVCVAGDPAHTCSFSGAGAVQSAVDAAASGDEIHLRPGQHGARGFRDVAFGDLTIRAGVLVDGKNLTLTGDEGAVLVPDATAPASTLVVHRGALTLREINLIGVPPVSAEDDIYDGHGLFLVHGHATLANVQVTGILKMALSVRGDSSLNAHHLTLTGGHVGVWVEEAARVSLSECVIADNDSAAVAAYARARVKVQDCVLDNNQDDGLYAAGQASIAAGRTVFIRNAPYAAWAVDEAHIDVTASRFYANQQVRNDATRVTVADSLCLPDCAFSPDDTMPESPELADPVAVIR